MKKTKTILVLIAIIFLVSASFASAGWFSDLFGNMFKGTGKATSMPCGSLGGSKGYAQSDLGCYGKTGAAGTSCPSGYSNLGETTDCTVCCAKAVSSGQSKSVAASNCDQTIDRNTGQKCSGSKKNCDCSGACGSSTSCSSPCSGCSGSGSSSAQAAASSSECSPGCTRGKTLDDSEWNPTLTKPWNRKRTVYGYVCQSCSGGSQKCPSGYYAYDLGKDPKIYCCLKNGVNKYIYHCQ